MPDGALPSGTDWSLFLNRLVFNLYSHKNNEKSDAATVDQDISDVGGSVAKAAGNNPHTIIENSDGNEIEEDNIAQEVSFDQEGGVENKNTTENEKENDDTYSPPVIGNVPNSDEEHYEPKAPKSFFPSNLLVVLTMGVLSEHCELCLDHATDREGSKGANKASVPTRAEVRSDALMDQISAISGDTPTKPGDTPLSVALARSKERASYNEVYKAANEAKIDLGNKRLKIDEQSLALKELEVKAKETEAVAREKEVSSVHLNLLYRDLRQDLKDAKDDGNNEEVRRIKDEMNEVKRQRMKLSL